MNHPQCSPCPLCGGARYSAILTAVRDRLNRKRGLFDVARCTGCDLVATCPRPADLGYYYQGVYDSPAAGWVQSGPPARAAARYRVRAMLARIGPIDASHHVLDVGCSYGTFLSELRARTGCRATGIDTDPGSLAKAHDRGRIRYRLGSLEDLDADAERFDVVTLFQSLEHHADPVRALSIAHQLLKPGGACVVEVPNFDGAWRHVFRGWWLPLLVPQHLFHFTPATLRATMERAGFEVRSPSWSMFYPTESTISIGLWLNELLGRPLRAFRPRWSRPDGWLLALFLVAWWAFVELPTQAVLTLAGRSGVQLMIGRRSG